MRVLMTYFLTFLSIRAIGGGIYFLRTFINHFNFKGLPGFPMGGLPGFPMGGCEENN